MTRGSKFVARAREYLESDEYQMAGEYYSIASHAYLAESWDSIRKNDLETTQKGWLPESVVWQEYAATCYTLADSPGRTKNRARQAILTLKDIRTNVIDHSAWIGLTWELEGDFNLIAGLNESDDAYETALEYYGDVESNTTDGNVLGWVTEPGINETLLYVMHVANGVGIDLTMSDLRTRQEEASLREHVEYKQANLRSLLDQLFDQGTWNWEITLPTREELGDDTRSESDSDT